MLINKMKRQRNTQQVKEQDKRPPNQTKEEEIGNLPDKEFQIMTVKMIQNLEHKMELQINSLETRIEKMQEKFNKDLEEIKNSQYIMNNAILLLSRFSRVRLFATPWTAAYQAPPSMGFARQEYWSGVPLPSACLSLGRQLIFVYLSYECTC